MQANDTNSLGTTAPLPGLNETREYLSFSRLDVYGQCGKKYELSYVNPVPRQPSGAFIGGLAVHTAVEEGEKQRLWDNDDDLLAVQGIASADFERRVEEAGGPDAVKWAGRKTKEFPGGEDYPWWQFQVKVQAKRWVETRRLDAINGLQLHHDGAEMGFGAYLPTGTYLKGRIDAFIYADANGEAVIRDYKTGKVGGANPLQLAVYAWALQESRGLNVKRGEYVYLRRLGEIHSHDLTELIPLVPQMYGDMERALRTGVYMIQPNTFCKSCSVGPYCPYGRTFPEHKGVGEDGSGS